MNFINDYALNYHEQIIKLDNETSEVCEDSRYQLGKWANIRWDILVQVFQKFDMLQRYADGMWF
jgi:hypothetical protein